MISFILVFPKDASTLLLHCWLEWQSALLIGCPKVHTMDWAADSQHRAIDYRQGLQVSNQGLLLPPHPLSLDTARLIQTP